MSLVARPCAKVAGDEGYMVFCSFPHTFSTVDRDVFFSWLSIAEPHGYEKMWLESCCVFAVDAFGCRTRYFLGR